MTRIDLGTFFENTAKLEDISTYLKEVNKYDIPGKEVILTGKAPIWMYLVIAHHLHGIVKSLTYDSPVTGPVIIYNHNPF